jgi:Flp pilus assembly protein TadD
MRLMTDFDWHEFVEDVSLPDQVLRNDTNFAEMDFATRDAYRHAIEWQEGTPHQSEQPYLNLGSLLLELDRAAEAIAPLEKAVELGANNASCHLKLGTAYLRTNQLPEAQRALEKAERLDPENAAIHYQLGKFYKQTHQMDKAKIEFQRTEELQSRAAKTQPSSPPEP